MGNSQSSRVDTMTNTLSKESDYESSEIARGRKSSNQTDATVTSTTNEGKISTLPKDPSDMNFDNSDDYLSLSSEDEESDEEEETEVISAEICHDILMLQQFAQFYLHPENSVKTTDPFCKGRNFFGRPSAPDLISKDEADEKARVMEEVLNCKRFVRFYLHPEDPVITTDSTASGRNFFTRPSAEEYLDPEETQERDQILQETLLLKEQAEFYMHPEKKVVTTDPSVFGRNYFMRSSAPNQDTLQEVEERMQILQEASHFKMYADFYMHPEKPVASQDAMAFGRNYFTRPSASEYLDLDEAKERDEILKEVSLLKQYAEYHLHPEKPVKCNDATACGRNYYTRASAPEYLDPSEDEERYQILQETALIRQYAEYYMHPEKPVRTVDPTVFGRNYFLRASASDQETVEETEDRMRILQDVSSLKQSAEFYLHPEKPVHCNDATIYGRNYFTRPSASEYMDAEEERERETILKEMDLMKQYANHHLHPEKPVQCTDRMACGRNYFTRASAPEYLDVEETKERDLILQDASLLKRYAGYHLHPEQTVVTTDPMVFGRNYFMRASAPEQEAFEESEERNRILLDVALLRQNADFYLHPEKSVVCNDATACGRNYFTRPSAPCLDVEEEKERNLILQDVKFLKQYAGFFLHPENPVLCNDAMACARNYFTRASASEYLDPEEAEERDLVLQEAALLSQIAKYHLHPEEPVVTSEQTIFGRNYFMRASAPDQETFEESEERIRVLQDVALLKQNAEYYLHPERPVVCIDATAGARNYFTRASAPEYFDLEEDKERKAILEDAALLKQHADFHLHPEKQVLTTDYLSFGRNYFSRASAPEILDTEECQEREQILQETALLKEHAKFHLYPECPVQCSDPNVCARNYFTRASASEYLDPQEAKEREQILLEAALLKKHAVFHLHPEKPVECTDASVCGRNYYTRFSAPEYLDPDEVDERDQILHEALMLRKYADFYLHPEKPVECVNSCASGRNFFNRYTVSADTSHISSDGWTLDSQNESYDHDNHFDFDEDMAALGDLRSSLYRAISDQMSETECFIPLKNEANFSSKGNEENEGKLSRSPSCVMLFGYEESNAY